jgi:hypothetical protein
MKNILAAPLCLGNSPSFFGEELDAPIVHIQWL